MIQFQLLTFDPELQDQLDAQKDSLAGAQIIALNASAGDDTSREVIKQEDVIGVYSDLVIGTGEFGANTFVPSNNFKVDATEITIKDILFLSPPAVEGNIPPLNNCVLFVEVV